MSKLEQKKEIKKLAILAAAEFVFLEDGFSNAKMDNIALMANVTKQTVYRYYTSKEELFSSTIEYMGEQFSSDYLEELDKKNTEIALLEFAKGFIRFHTSKKHVDTYRLIVSEGISSTRILDIFKSKGSDEMSDKLCAFIKERMHVNEPKSLVDAWLSILLGLRNEILMGADKPSKIKVNRHAKIYTNYLLKICQ